MRGRKRAVLLVLVGSTAAATLGGVSCSSFDDVRDGPDGSVPDGGDTGASAAETSTEAGVDASPSDATARTGIRCGKLDQRCKVGERCCGGTAFPEGVCAASCATVDGSANVYECGQASDCETGQECCFHHNGACASGYAIASTCLGKGLCTLCLGDAGGNGAIGCDPTIGGDCVAGHDCTRNMKGTRYTGCSL